MGAMWDEPGWLHNRMGQISKRVRAQLMAKSEFELKVVDSGVWQLDLAQPRIPATERAGFASTEAYPRGFFSFLFNWVRARHPLYRWQRNYSAVGTITLGYARPRPGI